MSPAQPDQPRARKPLWKKLALIPAGLAAGLLVGWLGLWGWDAVRPRPQKLTVADYVTVQLMLDGDHGPRGLYLFDERIGYRFKPNGSGLRHQTEDSPHHTNSLGLLGERDIDPDPAVRKVLVLGDSVTYGDGVPFEAVYVSRMQELAGDEYQLANGACPGWNLQQQLGFYDAYLSDVDWSALVVALCLNDFVEFMWARVGNGQFDWMMTETTSTLQEWRLACLRNQFRGDPATAPLAAHDDATLFAWQPSRVSACLQEVLLPFLEEPDRPPLTVVVLPTRHQLEALHLGAPVATALWPQREVATFCEQHGVPCLDVATLLAEPELPQPAAVYLDGDALHLNEAGHALLAESLWPPLIRAMMESNNRT